METRDLLRGGNLLCKRSVDIVYVRQETTIREGVSNVVRGRAGCARPFLIFWRRFGRRDPAPWGRGVAVAIAGGADRFGVENKVYDTFFTKLNLFVKHSPFGHILTVETLLAILGVNLYQIRCIGFPLFLYLQAFWLAGFLCAHKLVCARTNT